MNRTFTFLLVVLSLLLCSCAYQKASKRVNEQLETSPEVQSKDEMIRKSHELLLKHPALTKRERQSMQKIFYDVRLEMAEITNELGKLKFLFFKKLLSEGDHQEELDVITERMARLNFEKMKVMVSAMKKSKKLLSKNARRELGRDLLVEYPFD